MLRPLIAFAPLLLAATADAQTSIAQSNYRTDQPEVLAAPPLQAPVVTRTNFAAAYARAGRPTVAVLWNREFSDMLEQGAASQLSVDTTHAGIATGQALRIPGYTPAQTTGAVVGNTTITAREIRAQQAARGGPVERVNLQMRSAFIQQLAFAGVKVVDRNLIMRTTARQSGDTDAQKVEIDALSKHSKLMIEVLNTPDPASPTGWATYVSIKRLNDGVVLAEGYMDGNAPHDASKPLPRFEADPRSGGFREVRTPAPQPSDMGRLAAEQTLARLADSLLH